MADRLAGAWQRRAFALGALLVTGCGGPPAQAPPGLAEPAAGELAAPPRAAPPAPAAILRAPTPDGWSLALHHFPSDPAGPPQRAHPVVLCHGISSNKANWDLDPVRSFPAYLARHGFDVYVLELRGAGESRPLAGREGDATPATFDLYATVDLPAAIEAVQTHSGARRVHWVGHSMGGMVMYAYLQTGDPTLIRSFTAVGSPPRFRRVSPHLRGLLAVLPTLTAVFDVLPARTAAQIGSPWVWPSRRPELHLLWNDANLDPEAARRLAAEAVSDLPSGVALQLADAVASGHLRSADGAIDYTLGLVNVTAPALFVAGALDHLAPPAEVLAGFALLGSEDKTFALLGRAEGFAMDYGHLDLVVGEWAPAEVFPLLRDWIIAHD